LVLWKEQFVDAGAGGAPSPERASGREREDGMRT
jgi:hypothetical protein